MMNDADHPESPQSRTVQQESPTPAVVAELGAHLQRIDHFRIEQVLGEGGFGTVYQAFDERLERIVAIKVPRRERFWRPEQIRAFLAESRVVANLEHDNIVPVYYSAENAEVGCYVVSRFINGVDLAKTIRQGRLSYRESAELLATIATALHFAHSKGLVHRDIKPANILIDSASKPYLADFGLALKDEDFGKGGGTCGTPAYMSPEQARGEGHRVEGRSDIFSLGIVMYELLTGRRPFKADTQSELLQQIIRVEARPPRQLEDLIPKELERICLKALAKRASERYTTARDMAEDLRFFLQEAQEQEFILRTRTPGRPAADTGRFEVTQKRSQAAPFSQTPTLKIVPKGLRSFDANDADFFLELLPGPRDRDGLPESIRFWRNRIETKQDDSFSVGLVYGPSGCGKSSLIKAGLLPRLAGHVVSIYVEATADDTEARLLKGLRKHCPDLPENLGLAESLAAIRRGQHLPADRKLLMVIDQFEQWLHAKREEQDTELVRALRQCNNERVQCIVLVRDDFGMAATRFMAALDIPIVQGQNFATVDLFDLLHARKVLAEFGRAYGRLPDSLSKCTKEQTAFLDQAVAGLAQDGKVISVRLALFAEMVKGKEWTPATLKEVGGTEGVGVTFLEETFVGSSAPPLHRLHRKAAQAVLKTLLPETGTDIKGNMRSHTELLEASGYANRPQAFAELLRILDSEVRLITPTEPEVDDAEERVRSPEKHFQLVHDFLVPSVRDWLHAKEMESPWLRLLIWCRHPERVTNAGVVGIVIPLIIICMNVAVPLYYGLKGDFPERKLEWLMQWLGVNFLMILLITLSLRAIRRSKVALWLHAIVCVIIGTYFFASLTPLMPEEWVTTFGSIYDRKNDRMIPFLTFGFLSGLPAIMDFIALFSLRKNK